eukprot:2181797-Alexandrium_andersonii.AAC.1
MSASLVGSEMCIRDRVWAAERVRRAFQTPAGRRGSPAWFHRPRAGRAVSYTHLTLPTICSV